MTIKPKAHIERGPDLPEAFPADYGEFLVRFIKQHPMPKIRSPDESQVFGPIEFEDAIYFRKYSAEIECWSLVPALNPAPEPNETGPGDGPVDACAHDALISLPPPRMPADRSVGLFSEPFFYEDQRFTWILLPDKPGWILSHCSTPAD